jgi:uracil-DNA glycosylase
MITYFVDIRNGCDKDGDGLTEETAFASKEHAENVSLANNPMCRCARCLHKYGDPNEVVFNVRGKDK